MRCLWLIALSLASLASAAAAQRPTPEQAQALLRARPDIQTRLRSQIAGSGLTPDQIRARLVAAGYPATLLDNYLGEHAGRVDHGNAFCSCFQHETEHLVELPLFLTEAATQLVPFGVGDVASV